VRQRWLLKLAWGPLEMPLRRGLWVYQRDLLRRAFVAMRAAVNVRTSRLSDYWLRWRLRMPAQRCAATRALAVQCYTSC